MTKDSSTKRFIANHIEIVIENGLDVGVCLES